MRKLKRYTRRMDKDVRYRVRFLLERGEVKSFVVQLEVLANQKWRPVIRFDTAHGFPHCDRYRPDGTVHRHEPLRQVSLIEAFAYATETIRERWEDLARPFRVEETEA